MKKKLVRLLLALLLYGLLRYLVPYGYYILYPVMLFVTYLHEMGHVFFALITGGAVSGVQINANGSGYALIKGGIGPLVLSGGYIGSALFGNIILYIALARKEWNFYLAYFLMVIMLLTGIFLYQSVVTSIILFLFATVLYLLARFFIDYLPNVNAFLGTVSVCYILEDFYRGPASDLAHFTQYFPVIPTVIWAVLWFAVAAYVTYYNLRYFIFKT